jgi:hypothetical protein
MGGGRPCSSFTCVTIASYPVWYIAHTEVTPLRAHSILPVPTLRHLPASLPLEGAVRLQLQDGVLVLRASTVVQQRIAILLRKQQHGALSPAETTELDQYEDLDDYLSLLNRLVRNSLQASKV